MNSSFIPPLTDDVPPEIEQEIIERYRRMSAAEKLQMMEELNHAAYLQALEEIKRQHPNANPHEWQLRLASQRIEPELMRKAFGWDSKAGKMIDGWKPRSRQTD